MSDKTKILVIDDDPAICLSVKAILEASGYEVYTALSGKEGLELFRQVGPELVLCDMMMEDIDAGAKVAGVIKKERPELPVFLLSTIGEATASIARELSVAAVIPITQSGYTARMVAKYRPVAPIYAVTPNVETQRRLSLVWGVRALIIQPHPTTEEMVEEALRALQDAGRVKPDDLVVITAGVPVGVPGRTNLLHVRRVAE